MDFKISVDFRTSRALLCLSSLLLLDVCFLFFNVHSNSSPACAFLCIFPHILLLPPLSFTLFLLPILSFHNVKLKYVVKDFACLPALCYHPPCTIFSSQQESPHTGLFAHFVLCLKSSKLFTLYQNPPTTSPFVQMQFF